MTTRAPAQASYSVRGIQEMLGLSRVVILGLVDAGFVAPQRGPRNEYRFSFRDIVLLRTAVELRAAQIAPRKILAALRKLRASLPAEMPLTGLRITAVGNDVTVRDGSAQWQAESGQRVMDFEVDAATGSVSVLQHAPARRPAPIRPVAEGEASDAASWFTRAEALESRDRAAAEAAYRTALAIDPGFADASLNLGALLCEARRYGEAVTLYDDAVRLHPGEALLHFNRAVALEDQGRLEEALVSYNNSLQLAPDLADAHFNAARLHEQLGDAKKAVRHLSAYRRLQVR
ncbi:MAG: tetratricopeptide repeat protein [Caldimonas sp.]